MCKWNIRKALLSAGIVFLIGVCGCGENQLHVPEGSAAVDIPVTVTVEPASVESNQKHTSTPKPIRTPTPIPQTEFTEEQKKYLAAEISLSDAQLAKLRETLDEPVSFQYEEYFELEEAFAAYEAVDFSDCTTTNIVKNRVVDGDALLAAVKKNNAEFLQGRPDASKYKSYSDTELAYLCNLIAETLTNKMKESEVAAAYLDRTLSNLKIFQYESWVSVTYAAVQEEYVLAVSENYISSLEIERARDKVLVHECMHLLQIGPSMDIIGINYKSEGLAVNSLQNNWFYESSAEFAATEINGEQTIYQNIMKIMDALMVATAFEEESMENFNFSYNLYDFYEMFSCNNLISREEIARAMYALDVAHYEQEEFFGHYAEKSGSALDYKEQKAVKMKYQADAHTVFAKKLFYDISQQTLTLEEIFDIMSLFETVCENNLFYDDLYRMRPSLDFLPRYIAMQDIYFELLAESIGTRPENIRELYTFYHANEYVELEALEKSVLLNSIYDKTEFNKGLTIKEAYDLYLREGLPEGV